ncbi:MAG: hypothetical protein JXR73_17210 [Candidatus Omnitrophica bacterium]|nr:hypothetical protein [Candidatus Omnitrophota bacterium]
MRRKEKKEFQTTNSFETYQFLNFEQLIIRQKQRRRLFQQRRYMVVLNHFEQNQKRDETGTYKKTRGIPVIDERNSLNSGPKDCTYSSARINDAANFSIPAPASAIAETDEPHKVQKILRQTFVILMITCIF